MTDHWVLNSSSTAGLAFCPEGIGIRDHHLHALSLEIHQDGRLAGLDLVVGPLLRLLTGLDDEILVRLGQLVEERLVDQDSRGLDKVIGDDQMALDLVKLEGGICGRSPSEESALPVLSEL